MQLLSEYAASETVGGRYEGVWCPSCWWSWLLAALVVLCRWIRNVEASPPVTVLQLLDESLCLSQTSMYFHKAALCLRRPDAAVPLLPVRLAVQMLS